MFRKSTPRFISTAYADVVVLRLMDKKYLAESQADFIKALGEARDLSSAGKVVIDLERVQTMSSAVIGPMIVEHLRLAKSGGGIVAAGSTAFVGKVLNFANVPFETYPDVATALASPAMSAEAAAVFTQEN